MLLCTPAKTHLLIYLGNSSGLTDQLYRKYMWRSSLRKFVPCVRLINNEKKTKVFQPQAFIGDSMFREARLLGDGWVWTGGWERKAMSIFSCPCVFSRSTKERMYSPARYSWDEPSIPALPKTLPVQGSIPLTRHAESHCWAAACTVPINLEALMRLAGALELGIRK